MALDLTGKVFDHLTAREIAPEPCISPSGLKYRKWICDCDCGGERIVRTAALTSGRVTHCGCRNKRPWPHLPFEDLTDRVFGELTALRPTIDGSNIWICHCSCDRFVNIHASLLLRGKRTSCGALSHRSVDRTSQRFGRLTAIRLLMHAQGQVNARWLLRCDCGGVKIADSSHLGRGAYISCGCTRKKFRGDIYLAACPSCGKKYEVAVDGSPTPPILRGLRPQVRRQDMACLPDLPQSVPRLPLRQDGHLLQGVLLRLALSAPYQCPKKVECGGKGESLRKGPDRQPPAGHQGCAVLRHRRTV